MIAHGIRSSTFPGCQASPSYTRHCASLHQPSAASLHSVLHCAALCSVVSVLSSHADLVNECQVKGLPKRYQLASFKTPARCSQSVFGATLSSGVLLVPQDKEALCPFDAQEMRSLWSQRCQPGAFAQIGTHDLRREVLALFVLLGVCKKASVLVHLTCFTSAPARPSPFSQQLSSLACLLFADDVGLSAVLFVMRRLCCARLRGCVCLLLCYCCALVCDASQASVTSQYLSRPSHFYNRLSCGSRVSPCTQLALQPACSAAVFCAPCSAVLCSAVLCCVGFLRCCASACCAVVCWPTPRCAACCLALTPLHVVCPHHNA